VSKRKHTQPVRRSRRPLGPKRYNWYINSTRWYARRDLYFTKHRKRCAGCMTDKGIHLHHRTYARLGIEIDDDFTPLCEDCHALVHEWHELVRGKLARATDEAVAMIRDLGATALRDLCRAG
jgi:hypothetical protein